MGKHRSQEESLRIFNEVGMYSASMLNDAKIDGEWLRSVNISNTTYNGRAGRAYATRAYAVWQTIKSRSTEGGAFQARFKHYVGTTMCDGWRTDFNAFAEWYTNQVGYNEGWDIDKDLVSGTKHYSPDTCVLLPRALNLLFSSHHRKINVVVASRRKGTFRTNDGSILPCEVSARQHAYYLKVENVKALQAKYAPLGVPLVVFEKALTTIEPV